MPKKSLKGEMTPSMMIDYAEGIILKKFRDESIRVQYRSVPAYEWPGAGSEKGGSSGHLNFSRIIFAESEKLRKDERLAISVGRRDGERDSSFPIILGNDNSLTYRYLPKMYGILRVVVPEDFADEAVKREKNKGRNFDYAIYQFLKSIHMNYHGVSLFAFDGEHGLRHGLFSKRRLLLDGDLDEVLENFYIEGYFSGQNPNREKGIELSKKLAERLLNPERFSRFDGLENLTENSGFRSGLMNHVMENLSK